MKTKLSLGTLAVLGLLTLRASAQMTVDIVLTNGLFEPYSVAMDADNIVYIADSSNHRIVRFDPSSGSVATLAGNNSGASGTNDGPSYIARFSSPQGIVLAIIDGTPGVVVSDTGNHTVRFVNRTNGFVTTLAGRGGVPGSAGNNSGANARFRFPRGVSVDNTGILYIADAGNNAIRQINLADPTFGVTNLVVTGTTFKQPNAVAAVDNNLLWIADTLNHTIKLVTRTGPASATLTTLMGSNDQNVSGDDDNSFGGFARFNSPRGLLWLGNAGLVISDTGNQIIRIATNNPAFGFGPTNYGVVTIAGISGQSGFVNGPALSAKFAGPHGLARDPLGNGILVADIANNSIRRLQTGPTQPPVADPRIGWVDFVVDAFGDVTSVLRTDQPFVFNNDVIVAILAEAGTETFFTSGPTPPSPFEDTIPSPSRITGTTPPPYRDGLHREEVQDSIIVAAPDVTVKAIGTQDGRRSSSVVSARFQFKTANPTILGDNAALFTVNEVTLGAQIFYTIDGSEPTNGASSLGPISPGSQLSLSFETDNLTFKARAFRGGFKSSDTVTKNFSRTNYVPNLITFGFESGEASSDFVASPGQFFYAPVTLSLLPEATMYSLQFNVGVTNLGSSPPVAPGAVGFESTLIRPDPFVPGLWWVMPPSMPVQLTTNFVDAFFTNIVDGVTNITSYTNIVYVPPTNPPPSSKYVYPYPFLPHQPFLDLRFTDANNNANTIGVGWLERAGQKVLYDTTLHDLIKFSQPHDTIFDKNNRRVVPGGYFFQVPLTALPGDTYRIRLDRASATSDGVGGPGSSVFILSPTNGSLSAGPINGTKIVTIGQRKYVVGDAAPFRWFNAGDFGNSNLLNDDVMQVFQSAVYRLNTPLAGSDLFDTMDSCCGTYAFAPGADYLVPVGSIPNDASRNPLFDGNDQTINTIAFGDGILDITDVYVTFRRSLDPQLTWFQRFWTNGGRVAQFANNVPVPLPPPPLPAAAAPAPEIRFTAGEGVGAAGQTVFVPITASIKGSDPLRLLALGITVEPLDGSPALVSQVQFTPNGALGAASVVSSRAVNNYSAVWLNKSVAGLIGDAQLGYLQITLPPNCPPNAAYAIHFDHASGSPNGLAAFRSRVGTGLVTSSDRSASSMSDGIPDSWRLRYFGTAYNLLSHANSDADGDSAKNWQEFKAGTNPNDAASLLKLKSAKGQAQSVTVQWPSVLNKQYVIERAPSIYSSAWTSVSTNNGTGWDMEYQETAPGAGAHFYRVRLLP